MVYTMFIPFVQIISVGVVSCCFLGFPFFSVVVKLVLLLFLLVLAANVFHACNSWGSWSRFCDFEILWTVEICFNSA